MQVLCLGNNTEDTDRRAAHIAQSKGLVNYGLLSDLDEQINLNTLELNNGVYHTSVYDMTPGRIAKLSEQFAQTIVLGQPKSEWSHPDSYLTTINLVNLIDDLEFELKEFNYEYWKTLVETHPTICIFPFIELLVENGNTTVCCRSQKKITTLAKLGDYNTNTDYVLLRNKLLAGEHIENCSACYKAEQNGTWSARQQETIEWANRLNLQTIDDLKHINGPIYYEVRASNNCNLQCRICKPHYSKLIEVEYNQLGLHDPGTKYQYTDYSFVDINKVQKIYVAGGEPTAMPELYEFMRKCIDNNTVDFEFIINTNAHKISSTLLKLGSNFNLHYIVSIDGYGRANEYSRWLSKWDTQIDNIHKLINNGHHITFNVTVSLYTVFSFVKLVSFLQETFPTAMIHPQYEGGKFAPFIIEYSNEFINEIKTLKLSPLHMGDNIYRSFVESLIDNASKSVLNKDKLQEFFKFNDLLDQSRSVKLADYIPELEAYRNEC